MPGTATLLVDEAGALRYGPFIDALPVALYTTDAGGRLTYCNAAAIKLSGRVPEVGTDQWCVTWKLYLADGTPLPHDQCPMARALRGEEVPGGIECMAERPDGTRFWFSPYPAVLRDDSGRIIGGVNVLVDITDRRTAQIAANEQFRAIVETTPECVKLVAPDGALLLMNSHGLDMIGAPSAETVAGSSVYDLIAPEHRDEYRRFNQRICGGEKASMEFEIIGLNGVRRRMETHAAPLRQVGGSNLHLSITRDVTGRQSAERASLLLGAIVDSSDDAIVSKDLQGVITSWNQSAERLFGYTSAEAVGQPVTMLIPADRQDEEPQILGRLKRGERVDHFETVRRRKDGTLLDISLTISPIKDSQGRIIGASKIARDISERKRAEAAIRQLNAQLTVDLAAMTRMQQLSTRLVQAEDFGQSLGCILDTALEITQADMGNIQLVEGDTLQIAAQRGFEPPFLDFFAKTHLGEAACGTAWECGTRIIIEDLENSPVFAHSPARDVMRSAGVRAVQSTPLRSSSGRIVGMFSTHYRSVRRPTERELRLLDILGRQAADLIERWRVETALLASEKRFRQLADAMPQIVWTASPDGILDYANQRWYEFTGFERIGDAGLDWDPVLHPEDIARCQESWRSAVASGEPYNIEHRFWDRREHRWRWFMGRALPVRDARGQVNKWFGSCTDIDDQKRVEDDLRRANRDLEQFAFSASHDLQEPLRSIQIYSELLTRRYADRLDGDAAEFLSFVRSGATRLETLVHDLLAYAQLTRFEKNEPAVNANEALSVALANLEGVISEAGATVTTDPLPSLCVHAAHLQQLFQNLIGNAVKYRSPKRPPVIHVSACRKNDLWMLSVSDNGIGIEPEFQDKVFGLFKRLHPSEEYSGTGIGLAICHRIVDRYQGKIWVDSEPGRGSTFHFTLPG